MTTHDSITALILAAGYSSRMNGFKPLLRLGSATVLERVISIFRKAGIPDVMVVVGYRGSELVSLLEQWNVRWILNEQFAEGMFSSVKSGIAAIESDKEAFFLLPADIPLVRRSTVVDLIQKYRASGQKVIYPIFHGQRGHPPLISTKYIPEILQWSGLGGLGGFLKQKEHEAANVPVADEFIGLDMDTSEDYEAIAARLENYSIPSVPECMALLTEKFSVRGQLLAHSKMVAKVALRLGRRLNEQGAQLNLQLIMAAALLHDIAKGQRGHASIAAQAIRELDYPAVAEAVEAHMRPPEPKPGKITESDLVCLSDKLVQGDRIVTLKERFQKQLDRYSGDVEAVKAIETRLENAQILARKVEEELGTSIEKIILNSSEEEPNATAANIPSKAW